MAKKKFDSTKYQPTEADIQTLADAFAAYAEECKNAVQLMKEKSTKTLIVSNWDTVQKSIGHVDNFVRQVVPAAKFGSLDARIYGLLDSTPPSIAADQAEIKATREQQLQQKKAATKRKPTS